MSDVLFHDSNSNSNRYHDYVGGDAADHFGPLATTTPLPPPPPPPPPPLQPPLTRNGVVTAVLMCLTAVWINAELYLAKHLVDLLTTEEG